MNLNFFQNFFRLKYLGYMLLIGIAAYSPEILAQEETAEAAPAVSSEVAYILNTFLFLHFIIKEL